MSQPKRRVVSPAESYSSSIRAALSALQDRRAELFANNNVRALQDLDEAIGDVADRFVPEWVE